MNYEALFGTQGKKIVRAALIGVGQFGTSLVVQTQSIPSLEIPVLCDQDIQRVLALLNSIGLTSDDIRVCESEADAVGAFAKGQQVVARDASLLMRLPIDIVVEATGSPEAGAANGAAAINNGKNLAMVTKETDSVVGPILNEAARQAKLVYTPVDGDQPSLLIGLISRARALGLEVVAGGKSSSYDFIHDAEHGTVTRDEETVDAPEFADLWHLRHGVVAAVLAQRAELLPSLPRRIVPDLCEMGLVANATGLKPDRADFHAPIARTVELPQIFCPKVNGGILEEPGIIDVFSCLRREDEASFAGGVFVVDRASRRGDMEIFEGQRHPRQLEQRLHASA